MILPWISVIPEPQRLIEVPFISRRLPALTFSSFAAEISIFWPLRLRSPVALISTDDEPWIVISPVSCMLIVLLPAIITILSSELSSRIPEGVTMRWPTVSSGS